jgi:hypothetical protein
MSFRVKLNKMDATYEGGPNEIAYELEHMATARRMALDLAKYTDIPVEIVKCVEAGVNVHGEPVKASAKTVLVINPDGTPQAPAGAKMPLGVAHAPTARNCFCMNCRAARKP